MTEMATARHQAAHHIGNVERQIAVLNNVALRNRPLQPHEGPSRDTYANLSSGEEGPDQVLTRHRVQSLSQADTREAGGITTIPENDVLGDAGVPTGVARERLGIVSVSLSPSPDATSVISGDTDDERMLAPSSPLKLQKLNAQFGNDREVVAEESETECLELYSHRSFARR